MLVANLTNEVSIELPKNLLEKEVRVTDSFHIQSHQYQIGGKSGSFQVLFLKKIVQPNNPSSSPQNEENQETKTRYDRIKAFMVHLNEEELSTWGTNDETLLHTIATKLGVEVASFTYIDVVDMV